jgi:hypothetical protein
MRCSHFNLRNLRTVDLGSKHGVLISRPRGRWDDVVVGWICTYEGITGGYGYGYGFGCGYEAGYGPFCLLSLSLSRCVCLWYVVH